MRRTLIVGVSTLLLFGAGTAVALLSNDPDGPLPSEDQLRTEGFAVWPEDTLDEGMESCENAEAWQLDPEETALRFASEVINEPEEGLTATYNNEPGDAAIYRRYDVNSPENDAGSEHPGVSVHVRKYGRCWFVFRSEPGENNFLPSIAYAVSGGAKKLIVRPGGYPVQLGYGPIAERMDATTDQAVIDISQLEPGDTGHVIAGQSSQPLGFVPPPATTSVRKMTVKEIEAAPDVCDSQEVYRHPHFALGEFFTFDLGRQIGRSSSRELELKQGDTAREIADKKWALTIQGTRLIARVPRIKKYCWRVITLDDDPNKSLLRSLQIGANTATFDLAWGRATSASVTLSSERGGHRWTFGRFTRPITGTTLEEWSWENDPIEVTVVLYRGTKLIAAERTWRSPRS